MKIFRLLFCILGLCALRHELLAFTTVDSTDAKPKLLGWHAGIVQLFFATHNGQTSYINESDFYTIGMPMGLSLRTSGKLVFDLEVVPFFKPHLNTDKPYETHLLFHPGVLYPLGNNWTFGFRLAWENGYNQFGFTPLINKSFPIGRGASFFVELVAPGRFGPAKDSGYTQVGGIHIGLGF
ncbi:MAG: hypothetical protein IPN29_06795 [Saprospiraceae bacterium]|nr:hypothetical protein [Saprospiraceae bacterium]